MADFDQASHPAQAGDVIAGKYRIEGVLGTGGMGIVFAATHLHLERLVAVKVMRAELAQFQGAVQRLVLEAKLAARLRSEHVCKVLDVGTLADGAPYVVMEYLEGADLATLLGRGPLPTQVAVDFILEACEALAEAHASHIVHRDLKPENLFVVREIDGTSSIKVLDFGISKQRSISPAASRNLTNPTAALGSPNYMPPEQMRSPKDVDARADIWAIGAILYELLTGRQAFQGETVPEVCAAVMSSQPVPGHELRPDLPRRLVQVIERCLQKDRQDRFVDVSELAAALAPFGSAKAPASLGRIERVLSGAHATTLVNSSLPPRVVPVSRPATPGTRSSTPRSGPPPPEIELSSSTITTGAAVALLGNAQQRRRSLWIASAVLALLAAGLLVAAEHGSAERPLPPKPVVAMAQDRKLTAAAPALDSKPETSAAQAPAQVPTARAGAEKSKSPAAASRHTPRARPLAVSALNAPPPTTATATATPKAAAAVTGAWDPNSFGPRR
jgi:serine/threonine-protein kinase